MAKNDSPDFAKQAADQREALRQRTEEAQRKMDEAVPFPSQEQTDESMLSIAAGQGATDPEDPNEPEEEVAPVLRDRAAAPYNTRDMVPDQPRRGPGRPRKSDVVTPDEGDNV